jgi:hypothetical protein
LTPAKAPAPPSVIAPSAMASATPQPAPQQASLPPPEPPPESAGKPPPKAPAVGTTVATVDLAAGGGLGGEARSRLDAVVSAYRKSPSPVRVVAFAARASGGAEQLNSFRAALDRAQAVAKALVDAGLPADKVQTEATPAGAATPPGRVEVRLLP